MWTRKEVKAKGKASFKANFWKCVATALILGLIGGGMNAASSSGSSFSSIQNMNNHTVESSEGDSGSIKVDADGNNGLTITYDEGDGEKTVRVTEDELITDAENGEVASIDNKEAQKMTAAFIGIIMIVLAIVVLVAMAIGFVFDAFIINPIELGCRRFFRRNLDEPAGLSNLMFAFDSNYKNIVKTMFFRDLYITLWTMLFIIPGIVKSYEYKMIPYILSENPAMSKEEAFAESKRLMTGNKWKAFVLDLSFILWDCLSLLTCGIAGIFYVEPYKHSTDAALYEAIKYGTATPAAVQNN